MNLKIFENKSKNMLIPHITISGASGAIRFDNGAIKYFQLDSGKRISFAYDEETGDWYFLNYSHGEFDFILKSNRALGRFFCCTALAEVIIEWYNSIHNLRHEGTKKTVRFRLAINEAQFKDPAKPGTIISKPNIYALMGGEKVVYKKKITKTP